ncbi:hypothetical protein BDZ45DRAFT_744321 [Acephala macrosclerotiorum]|nr:hypothetical protein BDZ45DRAFT_744321 [Acephala macrosclerotiorum]
MSQASSAKPGSHFEHVSLTGDSSIRLVALEPGADDEPVRCSVVYASLDDEPNYEALSYVWGDPTITTPIFLDGKIFHVTINLCAALENLRNFELDSPPRVLWIDAICLYLYRYRTKYLGNLRFEPLFSGGFRFAL